MSEPAPAQATRVGVGVVAAVVAAAGAAAWASPGPHVRLSALFAFTAVLWLTEALPAAVTALLAVALSVVSGLATPKEAFGALGNPVLYLFVGSFMIAEAIRLHGLGARFAEGLSRRARGRLGGLLATSGAAFALSMWTSNAAATAVVLPLGLTLAQASGDRRYGAGLVLGVAWGASMGGLCTPVGTPPNLIAVRALADAGHPISFGRWMQVGTPIAVAMLVAMWGVLAVAFRLRGGDVTAAPPPPRGRWSRGEVAAGTAFLLAVVGWMAPGLMELLGVPGAAGLKVRLPEEVVALLAAALLFGWPVQGPGEAPRRALAWMDAARIDWGTVLLFGGGILLGDLAQKTGLADAWGRALVAGSGASSPWAIVALVTGASLVLSEFASNTASATLMVPLALGLSSAAGTPPLPAVLGATLGASFGFMMPVSTAPNAMAYATGQVSVREMVKTGIVFDLVGYAVVLGMLRVLCPLLGLDGR
ncbi:MAG: SLC13/DASS family transporter [Deltaproteobacteria bacterium]|nr:SLC13/DASS family transporter [Deltaproteobacteria bacterium]